MFFQRMQFMGRAFAFADHPSMTVAAVRELLSFLRLQNVLSTSTSTIKTALVYIWKGRCGDDGYTSKPGYYVIEAHNDMEAANQR